MKRRMNKVLAFGLSLILSGVLSTVSVFAAELIGTEIVAGTPNQVISVVAGAEPVEFQINVTLKSNLPSTGSFKVDTVYDANSSSSPSDTYTINTDETVVIDAIASVPESTAEGDYSVRINFSEFDSDGNDNALKDNTGDYLTIHVVNSDATEAEQDLTAPFVTAVADRSANEADWYNDDVTVSFTASDEGSGVKSVDDPKTVNTEGKDQIVTGTAIDYAGNIGSESIILNIDKTAPVITANADRATNTAGWYNSDVTVSFESSDTLSGIASSSAPVTLGEGSNQSVSGKATDNAGNSTSITVEGINIDKSKPIITVNDTKDSNVELGKYILNSDTIINWSASDDISGLATAENGAITLDTGTVGTKSIKITAADNAGNINETTITYSVVYDFAGILQPINIDGSSVFKFGSTVPVKFQLKDNNGNYVSSAVAKLYYSKIESTVTIGVNEADSTAASTSGNLFRYDSTGNIYIYNLSTKALTEGKFKLSIALDDGQTYNVIIGIRK